MLRKTIDALQENANDYDMCVEKMSVELRKYGIKYWTYRIVDLPISLALITEFGTTNIPTAFYEITSFYEQILSDHFLMSGRELFMSDFKSTRNIDLQCQYTINCKIAIESYKRLGHKEIFYLPGTSQYDGHNYLMIFSSKSFSRGDNFREYISNIAPLLQKKSTNFNDLGVTGFPNIFLKPIKDYNAFIESMPFNLLKTMTKNDLTLKMLAEITHLSESTITKHFRKIRETFSCRTTIGAYQKARDQGFPL